jgi:raffinose/stachyose/melibiose transport system permease protein
VSALNGRPAPVSGWSPANLAGLRRRRSQFRAQQVPWLFAVPALAMYGFIVLYPTLSGAVYAFTDWNGLTQRANFIGLANFREFLGDEQAVDALWHTLLLAAVITVVQNSLGLALAVAVNAPLKTRQALRLIFFIPTVFVPIVVGYIWQYLYTPDGPLNTVLAGIGLGRLERVWLGDPDVVLWAIAGISMWQYVGYSMVIFLAGLQGVPADLLEAAALDGANPWQRFWSVTFRMLGPAITINVMLTLIGSLKLFDQVFATTGGGPGHASETLATLLYAEAFAFGEFGYGTAIALLLTVLVLGIALPVLISLRRFEQTA